MMAKPRVRQPEIDELRSKTIDSDNVELGDDVTDATRIEAFVYAPHLTREGGPWCPVSTS